ncbi:HtaA domain-containing protein [Aeromicrobium sp.]|uniref:HtaA domain-containing protein n=1 Tax=Aeromicrobium sp. TaxID=1871063 RepID=UPI0028A87A84|nr:HtaA domain-containing protein [Aeromicrobium sp.]
MSPSNLTRGRRLLSGATVTALTAGVLAFTPTTAQAAETQTIESGTISWGMKSSFRNYLKSPIAHGTVTATAPATDTGTQTVFSEAAGSWADATASVGAKGRVQFYGHDGALDLTLSDPRIVVNGTTAQLVVDAVDSDDTTHDDLAFASIDLTGKVTSNALGVTIDAAPTTLTAAGAGVFKYQGASMYPAGTELDPISAQFEVKATPTVSVSKVAFAPDETATVTVNGSGFDPSDVIATRPPLAGSSSGLYVAFGKYEKIWRPTDPSAPASSTRKNADVRWAVLNDDIAKIGGAAAGGIELRPDGTFTAELEVSKEAADAIAGLTSNHVQYGIYTYPGGGAKFADWETYTPISFVPAAPIAPVVSTRYAKGGTISVTAPVPGTVTVAGLGSKTATAANQKLAFSVPKNTTAGTKRYAVSFVPADAGLTAPAATTVTVKIAKRAAYKAKLKVNKKPTRKAKGKATVNVRGVAGGATTTGKVRLKLSKGKKHRFVTVNLVKGKRTVKLPKLAKGKWVVRAAYFGNANYTKRGYVKVGSFKVTK